MSSRKGQQTVQMGHFFLEGEYWTMKLGKSAIRFRDSRGMQHLARLLGRPHESTSAAALYSVVCRPHLALADLLGSNGSTGATSARHVTEAERVAVTRALRSAIQRIAQCHPGLGAHLSQSIRTGQQCVYAPDSGQLIRWQVYSPNGIGNPGPRSSRTGGKSHAGQ